MGTTDGRLVRGEQTRRAILRRAADIASVEGLEGLSIGRLATELRVSKSGVFAHFGSKEELQLATIRAARAIFRDEVTHPAGDAEPGIARLWRLCDCWLAYSERGVFPGGCFFRAVAAEFAKRPGRVRDEIADAVRTWRRFTEDAVEEARACGELSTDTDPEQLTFELAALEAGANSDAGLYDDPHAYRAARRAILARLTGLATAKGRVALAGARS
jgi:AcrR family transcriptional regulator